jgi:hypothetical protein
MLDRLIRWVRSHSHPRTTTQYLTPQPYVVTVQLPGRGNQLRLTATITRQIVTTRWTYRWLGEDVQTWADVTVHGYPTAEAMVGWRRYKTEVTDAQALETAVAALETDYTWYTSSND